MKRGREEGGNVRKRKKGERKRKKGGKKNEENENKINAGKN